MLLLLFAEEQPAGRLLLLLQGRLERVVQPVGHVPHRHDEGQLDHLGGVEVLGKGAPRDVAHRGRPREFVGEGDDLSLDIVVGVARPGVIDPPDLILRDPRQPQT